MELPRRSQADVYLPDGSMTRMMQALRRNPQVRELRVGIAYAFDFRTRMLPYWYADKRMAPCSVRTLADVLFAAGFAHARVILQQWTPNFRPSLASLDGRPLDILMVSAMQVHAEPSYDLVRDAHLLGSNRPLILAGGPKAIYEPLDYFELGSTPGIGADCVVTGESFVLLELLHAVLEHQAAGETVRTAFERTRRSGVLEQIPGLVYLSPDTEVHQPVAINTGVQRLLRDLDEMPLPEAGFRNLEPPHRRARLRSRPMAAWRVRWQSPVASIVTTHGCKFNCSYCPIPAANQRTWRHKSPQRFAEEVRHLHETFGLQHFFGTDDNFFNSRETVVDLMTEMAKTQLASGPLGERIRFYTEATEFDVYKNRDILPLCRKGGMRAIWFGIEDITAELVNKGQTAGKTAELFGILRGLSIEPMAMMIHSDDQPLRTPEGNLSGLLNQARYLFNSGAVSYQCTYLAPAVGTRDTETAIKSKSVYRTVGGRRVPEAFYDGNHVVASHNSTPWQRQLNVLRAYFAFYNPINTARALLGVRADYASLNRLVFQIIGQLGLVLTAPKLATWARRLKRGPIEVWEGLDTARMPMLDVHTKAPMQWAVEYKTPVYGTGRPAVSTPPRSSGHGAGEAMALPVLGGRVEFNRPS